VGADDRLDDRQPEPRALSVARALGRKPLERLGEPTDRTSLPAMSQPSATDSTAMIASASHE
jgi:hypothetical protein